MPPTAFIMNMFCTGLGIARTLGEHGVGVIGLSAHRRIYGNFTRYGKTVSCPDSRDQPEELLEFLLETGKRLGERAVIFPTRDDDLVFLDRFREPLRPYFAPVIPESPALRACLNKWETYSWARTAGVATPRCWIIEGPEDLPRVLKELTYPCVLKPVASHHWRRGGNWALVGGRKAVGIVSRDELQQEYDAVARADQRAIVQEMVPGGDEALVIAACYLDRDSNWVAGFNTQKLAQSPPGFGTGYIVQSVNLPELVDPTLRLLQTMRFTGIAEVEYKWDSLSEEYKLIEVNPRPWDQHRLGPSCGVDLMYLAYCEYAGLPRPVFQYRASTCKWIAEDTLITTSLMMLWRRQTGLRSLFRLAKGRRIYAIWSAQDPLPFIAYFFARFLPDLLAAGFRALWHALKRRIFVTRKAETKGPIYEKHDKHAEEDRALRRMRNE